MFSNLIASLISSLLKPDVVKSLLRHAITLVAGAMGLQAATHGNDITALADAAFVIGSTAWGWYDAHKADTAKKQAREALDVANTAFDQRDAALQKITLGQPTEPQITAQLNREQLR